MCQSGLQGADGDQSEISRRSGGDQAEINRKSGEPEEEGEQRAKCHGEERRAKDRAVMTRAGEGASQFVE